MLIFSKFQIIKDKNVLYLKYFLNLQKNRTMNELLKSKVGELVAKDYRKATVFKKYGIDFCCGGGRTVEEACAKKGIDSNKLLQELIDVEKAEEKAENFDEWTLSALIDYIVRKHHKYIEENIGPVMEFAGKVAKVHGNANPEVVEINELFKKMAEELVVHMRKEELMLFPYIKNLEKAVVEGLEKPVAIFGTVRNPIEVMIKDHDDSGEIMEKINRLSNGYQPPAHACNTYRVLYAKLNEFENKLHEHVHLENNILFPKAIKLEQNFDY